LEGGEGARPLETHKNEGAALSCAHGGSGRIRSGGAKKGEVEGGAFLAFWGHPLTSTPPRRSRARAARPRSRPRWLLSILEYTWLVRSGRPGGWKEAGGRL
jgi:hypothetical protein